MKATTQLARSWCFVFVSLLGCGARTSAAGVPGDASVAPPTAVAPATSAQAAIADSALTFKAVDGSFTATNATHRFTTTIDAKGAALAGIARPWTFAMHLARMGRAEAMHAVSAATPVAHAGRVELAHDVTTEWYVHDARGLEQGFDVETRPPGAGDLVIEIAIEGLHAESSKDGRSIALRDPRGRSVLSYGQLVVTDAEGRTIAASMSVTAGLIAIDVADGAARFPLRIDPLVWGIEQAELVAGDAAASADFGASVAVAGALAIVGAPGASISGHAQGAAYVFSRSGAMWTRQAELVDSEGVAGDNFGASVAINGTTAIVGDPYKTVGANADQGAAYVFTQTGSTWTQQQEIIATGESAKDSLGKSVALSGMTAVALSGNDAFAFTRSGSAWNQQAQLPIAGVSVGLDGDTLAIGTTTPCCIDEDGYVAVYVREGSTWSLQANVYTTDDALNASFGRSLALSGEALAVTNAFDTHPIVADGTVTIFARAGTAWAGQQVLNNSVSGTSYVSVALSGNTLAIGANSQESAPTASPPLGRVEVWTAVGTTWTQQTTLTAADGATGDFFGGFVATDGTSIITGSSGKAANAGAAYVFAMAHANGDSCAVASDCATGNCADGFCCDQACDEQCEACNVTGSIGTCHVVAGAPVGSRTPCVTDGSSCGGSCDGVHLYECAFPATSALCRSAACSGGVETSIAYCDGNGSCTASTSAPCGSYVCGGSACKTACTADTDCSSPTAYCVSGVCVTRGALGAHCSTSDQCASGFCGESACCDVASCGPCGTCNGTSPGTCTPLPKDSSPYTSCGGFACNGASTSCPTTCVVDSDCSRGGDYCKAGICTTTLPLGATCAGDDASCTSGFCTDGVCCGVASCGAKGICIGPTGACKGVLGALCSAPDACQSGFCADGNCCDQACTGACEGCTLAIKGSGVDGVCGSAASGEFDGTCPGSMCTSAGQGPGVCDGAGACMPAAPNSCGNYTCNAASTYCKLACSADADCIATAYCASSVCIPKAPVAAICAGDDQCTSGFCVDSVCCSTASCGIGSACDVAGSVGTCAVVVPDAGDASVSEAGQPDVAAESNDATTPDSAGDISIADAGDTSVGGGGIGTSCSSGAGCTSGFCVDSTCCGASSCGPCGTCNGSTPGACTPLPYRTGATACAPFLCDGVNETCPVKCVITGDCASGLVCDTSLGSCVPGSDAGSGADASNDAASSSPPTVAAGGCALGANQSGDAGAGALLAALCLGVGFIRRRRRPSVPTAPGIPPRSRARRCHDPKMRGGRRSSGRSPSRGRRG